MIPAKDFMRLMSIGRKFARGEPLNAKDMEVHLRYPDFHTPRPVSLCGCGCGQPMPDPSEQYTMGGKYVRADCWYDKMGEEIEKHPILSPRLRHRA